MRMLTPPVGTPGFDVRLLRGSLNCSECIPTCYETTHEIEMDSSPDQRKSVLKYYSYLDVAYGNLGAKKYQRDITFAWTDLLGENRTRTIVTVKRDVRVCNRRVIYFYLQCRWAAWRICFWVSAY